MPDNPGGSPKRTEVDSTVSSGANPERSFPCSQRALVDSDLTQPDVTQADVQAAFCAVLCDEWARAGIADAIVSPGSRSTPMVVALDAEERIRVTVVLDERSSGFVALGASLAGGRPVIAVTTSGTAAVEMHPAVVEASQAGVAVIVVTTDRPPELHDVGAPQTVDQHGLYGTTTRWAFDPGVADVASAATWRSVASRCVVEAVKGTGPVHLNLPFREPLLGSAHAVKFPPGRPGGRAWHASGDDIGATVPADVIARLKDLVSLRQGDGAGGAAGALSGPVEHGLIVAGEGSASNDAERDAILDGAERLGWPVLADSRSGLRVSHRLVIAVADQLLRCPQVSSLTPQAVLRLGAPWASKVLGSWLASLDDDIPQVLVDQRGRWLDPDRKAWKVLAASPSAVVAALADTAGWGDTRAEGDWVESWRRADDAAEGVLDNLLGERGGLNLSEPAIARAALASLPDGGVLFVSSSMPVRDIEWFGAARSGVTVLSNRGANGIDGVLSSALGVALGCGGRPVVALVGDLAFLYDAGALLWAARREVNLSVLALDNDGGGIFSFLPYAGAMPPERFERYWGTPHGVDLAVVAGAYGVPAERIADRLSLERYLGGAGSNSGVRVGVVSSNRLANVADHERIADEIRGSLASPAGSVKSEH